ncbi:MAG: substrate-binding domain-containing protein [Campylobacterota bacterium]
MRNIFLLFLLVVSLKAVDTKKKIAYIVSDTSIPFWQIMSKGIKNKALEIGFEVEVYNSNNIRKNELNLAVKAIKNSVDAIIISPINSSSCVTVLKLANSSNIPVVVADIGADSKDYVSFISSNNKNGAYKLGKILAKKMIEKNLQEKKVGIVAIPQKRLNGQQRTAGFMKALNEYGIKSSGITQQVDFSLQETYDLTLELLNQSYDLQALWLQGSDKYKGALKALKEQKKQDVLLVTFDAEPIFLELIPKGVILASAMQQPFLMGEKAVETANRYLNNKEVKKEIQMEVLAVSKENIDIMLPKIKRNVLGLDE